jgi:hypothetical protein
MAKDQQCAICLFVVGDSGAQPRLADTTINGQAVCLDHISYVQGGSHAVALNLARAHEVGGRQQADDDDR